MIRIEVDGKHLVLGEQPFRVRGVTYGSFVPRLDGEPFPETTQLKQDLRDMVDVGLNTVRVYELPPVELLDAAAELGLRVIVGLQYHDWKLEPVPGRAAFRRVRDAGLRAVDQALERCIDRPEVLAVSLGNEFPADIVRLHGIADVEEVLDDMARAVHAGDPAMLTTYSSFPTTEFLDVDELDVVSFNVFLEQEGKLKRYLRHLQIVAGDRPLLLSEVGLASEIHGVDEQASSIEWQLRAIDEAGCAGATVYAWTDEWGVAGQPVGGWGFGITTESRDPKPAVDVIRRWAASSIADLRDGWPAVSVVVCAYNEERTIEECLRSLGRCDYPGLEVVLCDDGSTDRTLEIAQQFPFRILRLPHGGLSAARNEGIRATSGDIVAFLDADAACHQDWPYHLALSLEDNGVVATGGPNLPFPDAGLVEQAVAASPGGPVEVLISDDRAEHVPGCNMAYLRGPLEGIGGFDPAFTAAGDDVDVCWQLLELGGQIAFSPAAQIRHHRRATVRGYLRQQRGYGRAERMLSGPWRHRFNRLGQARWNGFIYGGTRVLPSILRPVVYHGSAGSAPFQPVTARRSESYAAWFSAMLPCLLAVALLALPLAAVTPWAALPAASILAATVAYGASVAFHVEAPWQRGRVRFALLVAFLHVAQPFVRTWGRLRGAPVTRTVLRPEWTGDRWSWMRDLERELVRRRCVVRYGEPRHRWDLTAAIGPLLNCDVSAAIVWDWAPCFRRRLRPRLTVAALVSVIGFVTFFEPGLGLGTAVVSLAFAVAEGTALLRAADAAIAASTIDVIVDVRDSQPAVEVTA